MDEQSRQITIGDVFKPLKRYWYLVVLSFVSVVLTIGFFTFTTDRVFESSATISLREGADLRKSTFDLPGILLQKYLVKNQVAILESRRLATEVIETLRNSDQSDSLAVLGFHTPSTAPIDLSKIFPTGQKGRSSEKSTDELVSSFLKNISVSHARESDIIEMKVRSSTPWEAMLLVNTWLEEYQEFNRTGTKGEVTQTRMFLESKLKDYEGMLAASEEQLTDFQKRNKVISLSDETGQLVSKLSNFESNLKEAQTEYETNQHLLLYLKDQLSESKKHIVEDIGKLSNENIKELRTEMAQLESQKATFTAQLMGAGYNPEGNEKLRSIESRLEGIRQRIMEETKELMGSDPIRFKPLDYSEALVDQILALETTQKSLLAKMDAQEYIINEYTRQIRTLPDKSQELFRLRRDVQVNDKIYTMLRENLEQTRIREAGQEGQIHIVDYGTLPIQAVYPKTKLNFLLACFFGSLLGAGLAFSRYYFEDSVREQSDVEGEGLRIIGMIPMIKNGNGKFLSKKRHKDIGIKRAKEILPYLLLRQNGYSTEAEAYRTIRTSIYLANQRRKFKTLLITSPGPAEGKSTLASNIAISFARKGVKTLLVDNDLRRPVMDVLFTGSHRRIGLSNYLAKQIEWKEAVRETSVPYLNLLSAGQGVKNGPELISSKRMLQFIKDVKQEYDRVIIDSPPMLPVTDATILSSIVDGVILVVRTGKTKRTGLKRSIELLMRARSQFLGVVMSGIKESESYEYENYYKSLK